MQLRSIILKTFSINVNYRKIFSATYISSKFGLRRNNVSRRTSKSSEMCRHVDWKIRVVHIQEYTTRNQHCYQKFKNQKEI